MRRRTVRKDNHREKTERESFKPRNPTGTWMDSRLLHLSGLPQHGRDQVRGYPRRNNSIPQSIRIEVERRKESRNNVNSVTNQEGQEHACIPPQNPTEADRRALSFAAPMAMSKLATNLWIAGVILLSLDNLVGAPKMVRTTTLARTTRLARMAGLGRE